MTDEIKKTSRDETLRDVLDAFVYVVGMDRFVNIKSTDDPLRRVQFDAEFRHLLGKGAGKSFSDVVLSLTVQRGGIRKFKNVGYVPGEGVSLNGGLKCNLYRPSGVTPIDGDMTWWFEHIAYLFPDEVDRKHLMNWLAWFYQNPTLKPKHALLMQGRIQGTGKSFISDVLAATIGEHNREVVSQTDLAAPFNGYAMRTKLITIEELRAVERGAVKNALHDIITQDWISINEKNMPKFKMRNCFGIIAMTNDDAALSLDVGDRRYLVLRTKADPREPDYYTALYAKINDPAAVANVAFMLQSFDVGEYNGASKAPYTDAKIAMTKAGAGGLEQWMVDNDDVPPLNLSVTTLQSVLDIIPAILTRRKDVYQAIGKTLENHFKGVCLGRVMVDGARQTLWAINGRVAPADFEEKADRSPAAQAQRNRRVVKLYKDGLTGTKTKPAARHLTVVADNSDLTDLLG